MPTLGQAASQLRISRHTLDKWIDKLGIEPTRHEFDLRVFMINDEDIQRIRKAREEMPGALPGMSPVAVYRPSVRPAVVAETAPPLPTGERSHGKTLMRPRNKPREPRVTSELLQELEEGHLVTMRRFVMLHGLSASAVRHHAREGRFPVTIETNAGDRDSYWIGPGDAQGAVLFLKDHYDIFKPCPLCPHSLLPYERDRDAGNTRPIEKPFPVDGEGLDDE